MPGDLPVSERDPVLSALMRMAQADFSVPVPRTFSGDRDDTIAYLLNLMGEELSRLVGELTQNRAKLEAAVEEFVEALVAQAAGDFSARARRRDDGSPLDVLAFVINNSGEEVGRLFEERNRAYEDLRQARETEATNRAKSQFLANVSHELRTPLTLILGPLRAVLQRRGGEMSAAVRRDLEIVLRNASRLARMVNDLLDFTRVEAGKLAVRWQMVDLGALVGDVSRDLTPLAQERQIALECEVEGGLPDVVSDRRMFEKITMNLVGNALKFTRPGGRVDVRLAAEGERVVLRVTDTGIGIAAEDVERVFERFQQVDSSYTRQFEGTGLGLALVKEFAVALGGDVSVESAIGKGSSFTVRVPLRLDRGEVLPIDLEVAAEGVTRRPGALVGVDVNTIAPAPADELGGLEPAGGEAAEGASESRAGGASTSPPSLGEAVELRPYVLLAEDNADMRRYVSTVLGREFEVRAVSDGQYAIEALADRTPDVVLSDVMMPRKSGFDVVRHVKGDPKLASVPVVLLTARAGSGEATEGLDAGADDYLPKPFSPHELVARVRAAARLHATTKRLAFTLDELQVTKRQLAQVGKASYASRVLGRLGRAIAEGLGSEEGRARLGRTAAELVGLERLIDPPDRERVDLIAALEAAFAPRPVTAEAKGEIALHGDRERCIEALNVLIGRLEVPLQRPIALRVRSTGDRVEVVAELGSVDADEGAARRFSPALREDDASLELDALRAAAAHVCLLRHGVEAELETVGGEANLRLRLLYA